MTADPYCDGTFGAFHLRFVWLTSPVPVGSITAADSPLPVSLKTRPAPKTGDDPNPLFLQNQIVSPVAGSRPANSFDSCRSSWGLPPTSTTTGVVLHWSDLDRFCSHFTWPVFLSSAWSQPLPRP